MKKVIVTGCGGQDGSYMVDFLLKNTDYQIIGTVRRTSQPILSNLTEALKNPRFTIAHLDLNDIHSITSFIKNEKPDYFINFGASAFVPDSWNQPSFVMQTNAIALIHILEAVKSHSPKCRVYSSGSSEQWGDALRAPQNEDTEMRPRSIYGVSKCTAGMICKVYRESYSLYVVHGILFNHESERRQEYYVTRKITKGIAQIAKAIKSGDSFKPLELGNLDAKRDWSHAADFSDGIWRMLNQELYNEAFIVEGNSTQLGCTQWLSKRIKEYVLSSDETHTVREFVELACKEAGLNVYWVGHDLNEQLIIKENRPDCPDRVMININPKFYRPAEVHLLHGDSSAARKELGWQPKVSFEQLVSRMVKNDLDLWSKAS